MGTGAQKRPRRGSRLYSYSCLGSKEKNDGVPSASSRDTLTEAEGGSLQVCFCDEKVSRTHLGGSWGASGPRGYGSAVSGSQVSTLMAKSISWGKASALLSGQKHSWLLLELETRGSNDVRRLPRGYLARTPKWKGWTSGSLCAPPSPTPTLPSFSPGSCPGPHPAIPGA